MIAILGTKSRASEVKQAMDCVKTLPLLLVFPVMAGAEGCYGMNYVPHKGTINIIQIKITISD